MNTTTDELTTAANFTELKIEPSERRLTPTTPQAYAQSNGLGRPDRIGAQPRPHAVFLCAKHGKPFMGGPCGTPQGVPVLFPVDQPARFRPPAWSLEAEKLTA